jgi:hypothetical protein
VCRIEDRLQIVIKPMLRITVSDAKLLVTRPDRTSEWQLSSAASGQVK